MIPLCPVRVVSAQGDIVVETGSEIPNPIDFNDASQVHQWITETVQQRVWRPRFFATCATALNDAFDHAVDVIELGSGPGHLAREMLATCRIASYTAVDFSVTMHGLARQYLGDAARRVRFALKDFRGDDWASEFTPVDVVLTMQAVHEVRHRSRQPKLFERIHHILKPDGLLLYCDHYDEGGSAITSELYLSREEQPKMLKAAGFRRIDELLDLGGMALYRARA